MTSSKPYVQVKAITAFYRICLEYPEALKPGYPILRGLLDDSNRSIVLASLGVLHELCIANTQNFLQMIPKFAKMLTQDFSDAITIKIIQILTLLAQAESRLPKKLVQPYAELAQNTPSLAVFFEIGRSAATIPITESNLLSFLINRVQEHFNSTDENVKSMSLSLFMQLLKLQPRIAQQMRETVMECLSAEDETQQLTALDLIGSMANGKNIDGMVGRIFSHFQSAVSIRLRNQIFATVVKICSNEDYKFVRDFQWYVNVLFDFVNEAGFTSYDILAVQLLDLVTRVPATRAPIAAAIPNLFERNRSYHDALPFLIASAHIVAEYAQNSLVIDRILQNLVDCKERVQQAFLTAAIRWIIKSSGTATPIIEKLELFKTSKYLNIQVDAAVFSALAILVSRSGASAAINQWLEQNEDSALQELPVPPSLDSPIDLFKEVVEPYPKRISIDASHPSEKKAPPRRAKRRRQTDGPRAAVRSLSAVSSSDLVSSSLTDALSDVQIDPGPSDLEVLAQNAVLRVSLVSLKTSGTSIQANLIVANLTGGPISGIEIANSDPIRQAIQPRGSISHTLKFEVERPAADEVHKFVLSPVAAKAEPLEIAIHQKASLFLVPAPANDFDAESCGEEGEIRVRPNSTPQKSIRVLSKLLSSRLVTNKVSKTVELFSKASYGAAVLVSFKWEQGEALITVKSSSAELTAALIAEIDAALKIL
jgi:hypothetical protein